MPKKLVYIISAVRNRPPSQLLQYLNPWFIRICAKIEETAIPATIKYSVPVAGKIGAAIYPGKAKNAPSIQK